MVNGFKAAGIIDSIENECDVENGRTPLTLTQTRTLLTLIQTKLFSLCYQDINSFSIEVMIYFALFFSILPKMHKKHVK